jgi:toxin ParE1/3/4
MKPLILKKPGVDNDLIELFDFIAQDKLEPAERFVEMAAESFMRLAAFPGMGKKWESTNPRLSEFRMYPMPAPFRSYLIFYRAIEEGIEVMAVLHGARNLDSALARRMSH